MTERRRQLRVLLALLAFRLVVGGIVVVYVPYSILTSRPHLPPTPFSVPTVGGVVLIAVGTVFYLRSVWDFALIGHGMAPQILVARGTYTVVRNPMYLGLVLILLGEALVFRSWMLVGEAAALWVGVHLLVVLYEERALAKQFGPAYAQYCGDVPRWIPRVPRLGR